MKLRTLIATCVLFACTAGIALAAGTFRQVKPDEFDPGRTFLVKAAWLSGIGCPTAAKTFDGTTTGTFTDNACLSGDPADTRNEGLLLAKTGPTTNVASALAELTDVKGITLNELGYDIRKPTAAADTRGSHCGAGSPRFNVVLSDGVRYFVGCNSPAPTSQTLGQGWLRLRWGGSAALMAFSSATNTFVDIKGKEVRSITVLFDEAQDAVFGGPDFFGLAVLDNIDVNGTLVGSGQGRGATNGDNKDKHKDKHNGRHGDGDDEQNGEDDN